MRTKVDRIFLMMLIIFFNILLMQSITFARSCPNCRATVKESYTYISTSNHKTNYSCTCGWTQYSYDSHTDGSTWYSTGAGTSNSHYKKCRKCGGKTSTSGKHSYGSYKKSSETQHKTTCTTSGCPSYMVSSHTETTAATCTTAAYCGTCKSNYGSVNSTNHDYSKACPTCGTANIVCSRCGVVQTHTCDTTAPTSGTFQDEQVRYTNAVDGNTFRVHVSGVTDTGSGVEGLYLWVSNNGVASWNILEGQKMNTWYDAGSGWYDVPINGEGTYVIRVHSRDNAGNWNWSNPAVNINGTAIDETVKVDRVAPTYSNFSPTGVTYTNNSNYSLTVSVNGADNLSGVSSVLLNAYYGSYVSQFTSKTATYNASTGKYEVTYSLSEIKNSSSGATNNGEGTYTFDGRIYDNAGNSAWIGSGQIVLDTTGPNHGYFLDGTPRYTNAADGTTFRVHAQGASDSLSGVDAMYLWVSTDGGASWNKISGQRMNEWDNNGTRAWYYDVTISGEGTYLCHTCPLDKAGNWTWGGPYETVIVDRTLPTVSTVSTSQYYYGNGTTSVPVTISGMSDNLSGLKTLHYAYCVPGADWVYTEIANTSGTATINIPISTEGVYNVAVKVIDNAGNWSNNTSDTYGYLRTSFVYDATAPTASDLTLSTTYTNTGKLRATAQGVSDNLSGVNRVQWYVRKSDWSTGILDQASTGQWYYDIDVTSLGEGTYIVGMVITDNAGNVNDTTQSGIGWKTFYYDKTAPVVESVPAMQIYNQAGKQVTFSIKVADNLSGISLGKTTWYIYAGESLWSADGGGAYDSTTHMLSKTVTLPDGSDGWSGNCTFNARPVIYDSAGNYIDIRNDTSKQIQVMIDTKAPTSSNFSPIGVTYTNNSNYSLTVSVNGADNLSGVKSVLLNAYYGSYVSQFTSKTATYNTSTGKYEVTYSLSEIKNSSSGATNNGGGTYTFDGRIYDNAGNSAWIGSGQIVLDTVAPTAPTYVAKYDDGTTYTSGTWTNKHVNTTYTTTESLSGLKTIQYSYDKTNWSNTGSGVTQNGTTYTIEDSWSLYNRNQTAYFRAIDNAGNISDISEAFNIKYDITAPTAPTYVAKYDDGTTYTSGTWTNKHVNTTYTTTESLSGLKTIQYSYDKTNWSNTGSGVTQNGTTYTIEDSWSLYNRNQTAYFRAIDNAGNISDISEAFNIKYDITAPVIESVPAMKIYNQAGKQVTFSIQVTDNLSGINPSATIWHIYAGNTLWSTGGNAVYDSTTHMLSQTVTLPDGSDGWSGNCIFNARPVIYDNAGNYIDIRNDTSKEIQVMIDTTAPTGNNFSPGGVTYTNNPNYTFTESVSASDNLSEIQVVSLNALYGEAYVSQFSSKNGSYNSSTGKYEVSYTLSEIKNTSTGATNNGDGYYYLDGHIYDNANNHTLVGSGQIVLDRAAPTVEVSNIAYGQNASIKLTDALAGIKYFAVTTNTTAPTSTGSSNVTTGNQLNYWYQVAQTTSATTVTFTGLEAGTYYAWGKDAAGNLAYTEFMVDEGSSEFITEWTIPVDADGEGLGTTIKLPVPSNSSNSYTVDWGDGTTNSYTTEAFPTHTYTNTSETVYEIKVLGKVNRFGYNNWSAPTATNSYADYYTFTQYVTGLKQWGELEATQYGFSKCSKLAGTIPSPTENSFQNVTSFYYTFYNCSSLTGSIPAELFANTPNVTSFNNTFGGCSGLTGSIPAELFANTPNVTSFDNTFSGCSSLTGSIPAELFANTSNVTTFYKTFDRCSGLTGSIPAELFANTPNVTDFCSTFYNCSGLTDSIPAELFANTQNVTNFSFTFYNCSSLTGSIPADLFANTPKVTNFGNTFSSCSSLTGSIPAELFANTPSVTTFYGTFSDCIGLTGSIPAELFANTPDVTNFINTFYRCSSLTGSIPAELFANTPNVTHFRDTFRNCSGLTGSIPAELFASNTAITTVPTEWKLGNGQDAFEGTFYGCSNLTSAEINTLYCGYQMFYGCNNLTNITIGDNVQAIGTNAFKAISPYSSTNLLATTLRTTNAVASAYNWTGDNRAVTNPAEFITEWTIPVDVDGEGLGTTIKLPVPSNSSNSYTVDWGDGTTNSYTTEAFPTHTYTNTSETVYEIKVEGKVNKFGYNSSATPTATNSYADYYTFTQYVTGLKQWGELEATQYGFSRCSKLAGTIPSPTENSFQSVTSFSSTFSRCSGLTGSIPAELFANTPAVRDFGYTFSSCSGLTGSIPAELFANTPDVTWFPGTFWGCSGLTGSIPAELFANTPNVTNFGSTFDRCSGLTGSIPADLFANTPNVTTFRSTFLNCSNLTGSIPAELFANTPDVTTFESTFDNCSSLTGSIPAELFANTPAVTTFSATFWDCSGLTGSIPADLFANTPDVTSFYYTFRSCSGLTGSIPAELFANTPAVTSFSSTFDSCSGLTGSIPAELFASNTAITTIPAEWKSSNTQDAFEGTFYNCSNLTSANINTLYCGYQMFYGCNSLTDITIGDNVQAIGTQAFQAIYPYSSTNLLQTNLTTTNDVTKAYDWVGSYRTDGKTIITQPEDVTVEEGTSAQFSVVAEGNDLEYQWYEVIGGKATAITEENQGLYKSNIEGMANTTATTTITIHATEERTLSFDYMVSSEENNDKLTIKVTDANGTVVAVNGISGEVAWTNYAQEFTPTAAGTIELELTYSKNDSIDAGRDFGAIKNLKYSNKGNIESTYENDSTYTITTPDVSINSSSQHNWITDTEDGVTIFKSNSYNVNSSYATATIEANIPGTVTVSFDYRVSSESNYDELTIKVVDGSGTTTVANAISGNGSWINYSKEVTPAESGKVKITLLYQKDSSSKSNLDIGAIRNLKIETGSEDNFTNQDDSVYTITGSQWEGASYQGADTATLTIPGVFVTKDMDGNQYYCEVSNAMGKITSEQALLTVIERDISKATVTLNPTTFVYDGTAKTPAVTVVYDERTLVENTDYTVSYSNNVNVGTATVTITGIGNYIGTKEETFTISKATLTVTPDIEQSKVYGESDPTLTYTYSGNVSGEIPGFSGALSRATGENVGTYAINKGTLAIVDNGIFKADNYDLVFSSTTVNFTITGAPITGSVTITGINQYNETLTVDTSTIIPEDCTLTYQWYENTTNGTTEGTAIDGATDASYTVESGLVDKYIYVVVTASKENYTTQTFSDITDAGENESATVTNISLAKPSISGTYTYSGVSQTVSLTGFDAATMTVSGNARTDAGTQTVMVSLKDTVNYEWADGTIADVTLDWTIAKKEVSVTWEATTSFVYNGVAQAPTVTTPIDGVNDEKINLIVSGAQTNVGDYTATASIDSVIGGQALAENYILINESTTFEIVSYTGAIDVTLDNSTFTYDGTEHTPGVTVKVGDKTLVEGTDYTVTYTNNKDAGTGTVTITGIGNYAGVETIENFTIDKATLTVIPDAGQSKVYGEADPTLTYTYSGNVSGETPRFSGVLSRVTGENVGIYAINKGTLAITDNGTFKANNYDLVFSSTTVNFTITSKSVSGATVTLTPTTYVYDGNAKEPSVSVNVGGTALVQGIDYTVAYSNNVNVGTATATITGINNYTGTISKTFTITNATLSVTATDYTGTYDGAAHGITLNGSGVTGATITYGTTSGSYTLTEAPTYTNAGEYTVYFQVEKANYDTYTGSAKVTINKKSVSVVWSNTSLTYNGTAQKPTATADSGVTGETINLTVSGAQTNVGENYTATASIESVTGGQALASNYTLTNTSTSFKILADTGVTFDVTLDNDTFTYDGTTHTPGVTVKVGDKTLVEGTDYTVTYTNNKDAGTSTVTITGIGNYAGVEATENFTISKATLTVTPDAGQSKVYGEADPTLTYTYSGNVSGEIPGFSGALGRVAGENVGIYAINKGTLAIVDNGTFKANNYDLVFSSTTVNFTITSKSVSGATVTLSPSTYTYDGTAKTPTATIIIDGEELVKDTDYTISYKDNVNAGIATATITGINNYVGTIDATYTINKKSVSVEWSNTSLTYNGTAQKPTATADSGVTGETINLTVSGAQTNVGENYTATASIASVTGGQALASSYTLTNTSTSFKIVADAGATFDVTLSNNIFTYDGTAHTPGVTVKVGDKTLVEGTDYTVTYTNNKDAGTGTVTITGIGNYAGVETTENFTINKKDLIIIPEEGQSKIYGEADPILRYTYSGNIAGELPAFTGALVRVSGENVGTYAINQGTLTIMDNGTFKVDNYNAIFNNTISFDIIENTGDSIEIDFTINPKEVEVIWTDTTLIFNAEYQKPTATVDSGVAGETIILNVTGEQINVGTYTATASIASVTGGQALADNYMLKNASTTFEIVSYTGPIDVTLDNHTFTYDGTAHTPGVIVKVGDKTLVEGTDYTVTYTNNKDAGTGTVTITGIGNYAGVETTENFTINKATLTVTPNGGQSKVYGAADPTLTYTYSGNVTGETPRFSGALSRVTGENIGTYAINKGTLSIADNGTFKANNYNLVFSSTTVNFIITAKSVSGSTVTLSPTTYVYDGNAKEPSVSVNVGGTALVQGIDYTVAYSNNVNVGTATATITGINNYTGTISKTFTITNATLNVTATDYTGIYDGAAHGITLSGSGVTGATITYGTTAGNYTLTEAPTYTNVGEYTVYFQVEKANYNTYTGSAKVTINKKSVSVVWSNTSLTYNGIAQKPTATVASGVTGETINLTVSGAQINVGENYTATASIASVTGGQALASNYTLTNTSTSFKILADTGATFDVTLDNSTFTYDGTTHTPEVTVKVGEKTLVEGTDYTVTYTNNKDAGTGTVTITGIGNYAGVETTENFTINKATLIVTPDAGQSKVYGVVDPTLTYTYSGNVSGETPGFSGVLSRVTGESVGTYAINKGTLAIVDNGTFKANNYNLVFSSTTVNFTITAKSVSGATVTLSPSTYTYDGTAKTPTATIIIDGEELVQDTDYTISYKDNVNAGIATATIRGINNYTGTVNVTYTIAKKSVSVVWSNTSLTYNDTVQQPTATADSGVAGETINLSVTGTGTNVGTYTATASIASVTGGQALADNYMLKNASTTFEIVSYTGPIDVTLDNHTFTYDGTAHTPGATVKFGDKTLVEGTDYTVTYTNNKDAGTGTVTITGIGNYAGVETTENFTINKATLTVTPNAGQSKVYGAADPTLTYTYSGNVTGETPRFSGALSRVTGENVGTYAINKGTLAIVDNGAFKANNYNLVFSSTAVNFTITAKSVSGATVTLSPSTYTYDGTAKTPTATIIIDGKELVQDTDYTISYKDNVNVGTATAEITGINNYTGTASKTFTITNATLSVTATDYTGIYDGAAHGITLSGSGVTGATITYGTTAGNYTLTEAPTYTNAGEYTVHFQVEKANYNTYTGSAKVTINKKSVTVVWSNTSLTYNATSQKPTATVASGVTGETINLNVSGAQTNVGTYTATASIGSVTGGQALPSNYILTNTSMTYEITSYDGEFNTSLDNNVFTYDGSEHRPDVEVKVTIDGKDIILVEGTDYTVTYTNNKDVGTGTVTITGIGNYAGVEATENFTISKATLTVTPNAGQSKVYGAVDPTLTYTYSGNAIGETPGFSGALTRVTGENVGTYAINAGTLAIVDNGTFKVSNYNMIISTGVTFEITKLSIADGILTITPLNNVYDGTPKTPDIELTLYGDTLVKDRDYTVSYENNIEIGIAKVIITGIGNYEGTLEGTFNVTKPDISVYGVLTVDPNTFVYDGNEKRPGTTVIFNSKTLIVGVDYRIEYYNNINVGDNTAYVIATGIGEYEGELRATFSITKATLQGEVILSNDSYEYDATEKEPTVTVINENGKTLVEGVDFEVSYIDNKEVGTATVIITGIGNYEGELTKTFEIVKAYLRITLKDKVVVYTGNEIQIDAAVIENAFEDLSSYVIYKYYEDYQLEEELQGLPKDVGVYYVEAVLKDLVSYNDVESNMARLVIYGAPTKPNIIGRVDNTLLTSGSTTSSNVEVLVYGSEVPNTDDVEFAYKYSTEGVTWYEYTNPIEITTEGTTTIYAKAYLKENPALESDIATYVITIDKTPPVIKDIIVPDETDTVVVDVEISGDDIEEIFVTEDPTIDPSKDDNTSGDWKKVGDDENGEQGKTVIELTQGDEEKTIYVWAKDKAGNIVGPVKKKIKLSALKIGNQNNNKTTIMFKVTDKYLHTADITTDDIAIYVNDILSQGKITNITKVAITDGYKYTAVMENVTGDGALSIGLKAGDVYDRAGNNIDVANSKVPTNEITVDNTLPQVSISTNENMVYIIASDINMKAVMLNGEVLGRKNGTYTHELKAGINKVVVIDEYGNEVENEITYEVENLAINSIANEPVIIGDMKPVYWEGANEIVANSYTNKMYNYTKPEDAVENTASEWANAKTEDGSYWVWIPRFAYKVTYYTDSTKTTIANTTTNFKDVDVIFLKGKTNEYLNEFGETNPLPNDYVVADAFNTSKQLQGIWVSKYEASREDSIDNIIWTSSTNELGGGNITTTNAGNKDEYVRVVSKPNALSWNGIDVSTAFVNAENANKEANSHLIKNSEWEAVYILTESEYGRNGNFIDLDTEAKTGGALTTTSTGNITGVYDLIGGAWEYTATYIPDSSLTQYASNLINSANSDYKETITLTDIDNMLLSDIENAIFGDTMLENAYNTSLVIYRGGYTGSTNVDAESVPVGGAPDGRIGYRIVLCN